MPIGDRSDGMQRKDCSVLGYENLTNPDAKTELLISRLKTMRKYLSMLLMCRVDWLKSPWVGGLT